MREEVCAKSEATRRICEWAEGKENCLRTTSGAGSAWETVMVRLR